MHARMSNRSLPPSFSPSRIFNSTQFFNPGIEYVKVTSMLLNQMENKILELSNIIHPSLHHTAVQVQHINCTVMETDRLID